MTWLVVRRIAKQGAHSPDLLLRQRVRLRFDPDELARTEAAADEFLERWIRAHL
jgi:hypothetical protein